MVNIGGLVLKYILTSKDLDSWSKVKPHFLPNEVLPVHAAINRFYDKQGHLPNFDEIYISLRDGNTKEKIKHVELLDDLVDVDIDVMLTALTDSYTQESVLDYVEGLLKNITTLESSELIDSLSNKVFELEDKLDTQDEVFPMNAMSVIDEEEYKSKIYLGINNTVDAELGGISPTELILIGGYRGSGKSIVSMNISCNQYTQGNVTAFFSIEMRARETFNRALSILSQVDYKSFKNGTFTESELDKVGKIRYSMFVDAEKAFEEFQEHRDFKRFDRDLMDNYELNPENQLIIYDTPRLTLTDLDMHLQKLKTRFGDKFKVAVVDYINQIEIKDIYNWESQIYLAKKLKAFAGKYDIAIISPFQIDENGKVRFSKGILDSCDWALTLAAKPESIEFRTIKIRNDEAIDFASEIDWKCLKIFPHDAPIDQPSNDEDKPLNMTGESSDDIPWGT